MSNSYETFIRLHFRQDHWESALANRKPVPELYGMDEQCIEMINSGIKHVHQTWRLGGSRFVSERINIVTSEFYVPMEMDFDPLSLLEGLNVPYEAFENEGFHYQYERRFNPAISSKAKVASVLREPGNYYLSRMNLSQLVNEDPQMIQQKNNETLNPFKDYPELCLL